MFVVVTAISLLVQIYSTGYMHGDSPLHAGSLRCCRCSRLSMLFLVIANNLLQMFVGLGGRRRLLVLPHRPLLGGEGELLGGDQGVHHNARRRRGLPVRDLRAVRAGSHVQHHRAQSPRRRARRDRRHGADGRRRCCCSSERSEVGAVPAPRVASRRHGRSHAGLGADPRRDDGRGRDLSASPACSCCSSMPAPRWTSSRSSP